MSRLPIDVPQYTRSSIVGGSQVYFGARPSSFREMLPASFQQIPAYAKGAGRKYGAISHGSETLSSEEISNLLKTVSGNRNAADAAVRAGIIAKHNKGIYYNHGTTHDMVNAMASFLMDDFVTAAQGERKYGITNVEDPRFFHSIAKKAGNNKNLDASRSAMYQLQDYFGGWLNPVCSK